MATTVTLVGEGGVEWEFELPLTEVYVDQVKARKLMPKDADDRAAVAEILAAAEAATEEGAPAPDPVPDPPKALTLPEQIDAATTHAELNELAQQLGVEGFEEKKPNLNEKRSQLQAKATELAAAATA